MESWPGLIAWVSILIAGLVTLKFLVTSSDERMGKCLPPGPKGVPIFGYLPFIKKPYHLAFMDLAEKYGPIIRLRLGCKDVVVLSDLASIREGLANPDALYRPDNFFMPDLGFMGIVGMNGQLWRDNRRYSFQLLRNMGFAKKSMEQLIQEQVQCLADHLGPSKGQPTAVAQPLGSSLANIISALIFGQRYDLEGPEGWFIEALSTKFQRSAKLFSLLDFFPLIRVLLAKMPYTRVHTMNYVMKMLTQLVKQDVKRRQGSMNQCTDGDFIGGYMRKIQENKGADSHYNLHNMEGNALSLYGGGINPVRRAVMWSLYIAASDPDGLQARMQSEIDAVVGRDRAPRWEDRRRMPFTMASILETLRWKTNTPTGVHRVARRDTVIGGYHIPAGTFVVPNIYSLHHDPTHWKNPSKYDPTHFMKADGTEIDQKPQAFLPFSYGGLSFAAACAGKRACPGETLALMELFLYVTTLLQKFRVLPKEGQRISLYTEDSSIATVDYHQQLRFMPR